MNWLTNLVRPRLSGILNKKEVPDNLWVNCPGCGAMLFHRQLEDNLHVCHNCGHHLRLAPEKRLAHLYDNGQYTTLPTPKVLADPLKFRDQKKYTDRLKDAQTKSKRTDALIIASGTISGNKVVTACFDFGFMGGSMGMAVGEGLVAAADAAVRENAALLAIPASGGARMQEGILSLMQLPRSIIAVDKVKAAGLPYIVLLTDPTTGGVTASFAMVGDVHIAEPGTLIGFAGARVIESTIRETLPPGFQRAEYLKDHGMVDAVVKRHDLPDFIGRTLSLLTGSTAEKPSRFGGLLGRS